MSVERCTWCGTHVRDDDGFRLADPVGGRHAAFCRLEHIVPWAMRGARWQPGTGLPADDPGEGLGRCAECGDGLGDERVLLVRHRGRHRIGDAFCGSGHLLAWARAGGRWRVGG